MSRAPSFSGQALILETSCFTPSRSAERPTGTGATPQRRRRAFSWWAWKVRIEARVLNVMLKEIDTSGPFCTQCGAANGM